MSFVWGGFVSSVVNSSQALITQTLVTKKKPGRELLEFMKISGVVLEWKCFSYYMKPSC